MSSDGHDLRGQPFLIVGTGSSGSHLLSVLLDKHPLVACGPELGVFNKPVLYEDFEEFQRGLPEFLDRGMSTGGWFNHQPFFQHLDAYFHTPADIIGLARESANARTFVDRFFGRYLDERNKAMWGEQTLSNVYCVPQFLRLYPDARVIHLVRDGRDVMCSLMGRGFYPYAAAARWLYDVSTGYSHRSRDAYLEVKYRELVSRPEDTLRRICAHLRIAWDDVVLSPDVENEYWRGVTESPKIHGSWRHTPSAATISTLSVDRWRTELDEHHQRLFWSVRLTPFAHRRAPGLVGTTVELMRALGFDDVPQRSQTADLTDLYGGLRMWLGRSRFELQFERRPWPPLTWARLTPFRASVKSMPPPPSSRA